MLTFVGFFCNPSNTPCVKHDYHLFLKETDTERSRNWAEDSQFVGTRAVLKPRGDLGLILGSNHCRSCLDNVSAP